LWCGATAGLGSTGGRLRWIAVVIVPLMITNQINAQ
jgi:hypothetical protein